MKIYLKPPQRSRGLYRIHDALIRYAPPSVEVVEEIAQAEMVVLYYIGRHDATIRQAQEILDSGRKYAVIQVCLRSTQKGITNDLIEKLWMPSICTWSYYDLDQACVDDGWSLENDGDSMFRIGQFYHAPLGADAGVFKPLNIERDYWILSTGLSYLSESVRECALAARQAERKSCHLGADLGHRGITSYLDATDIELNWLYNRCKYVSGLRRIEGFELPAVEGLLCGARPILFDTPDYRHWYEPWGVFIEETDRQGVIDQLVSLFRGTYRAVTEEEIVAARERFDWERICNGFYKRIL